MELINRHVMKRDLRATSKQRRLYRLAAGKPAPLGLSRGELADMLGKLPQTKIDNAQALIKGAKRPTRYMSALLAELSMSANNRVAFASIIDRFKRGTPEEKARLKAAKLKLRGFTYADDTEAGDA